MTGRRWIWPGAAVGILPVAAALVWLWMLASSRPPLPDVSELEPAVAQAIRQAHEVAMQRDDPEAWLQYGRVLHVHALIDDAVVAYGRAARGAPAIRFESLYLTGCAILPRDPEGASRYLEEALATRNDYAPGHLRLAECYESLDRPQGARDHYQRALGLHPTSHAHLGLARADLAAGELPSALTHLEAAYQLNPGHVEVFATLSQVLARLDRPREARRAAAQAGDLGRKTAIADPILQRMLGQGASYIALERLAKAHYEARTPEDLQRALEYIERAIALRPDETRGWFHRATILAALGRIPEAIQDLTRVLRRDPDHADALCMMGSCLLRRGQTEQSLVYLRQALDRSPRHILARYNLAVALRKEGRREEALGEVEQVMGQTFAHDHAELLMALLLAETGNPVEARKHLLQILVRSPGNAQARRALQEMERQWPGER